MEKQVQLHPEWEDSHYVQYFGETLDDDSKSEFERQLAHLHLVAYFDLSRCHFVQQFSRKFPFPTATCIKFFDLTSDFLYNREKLKKCIQGYNFQDASGANLKTYLQGALRNTILDQINCESPWHLLCDVDLSSRRKFNNEKQKLREALLRQGIIEPNITRYIFAWQYFVPIYKNNRVHNPTTRTTRRWPEPELLDFEETTRDYNSNRFQADAPLQVSSSPEVTPEMIKKWMKICIEALQHYPILVEISRDADSYEKQHEPSMNPWEFFELEEKPVDFMGRADLMFRKEIQQINNSLEKIRSKIPQEVRKAVMPLCYPHEFSLLVQEQFASKVGINQGTVARYISNVYKTPLLMIFETFITDTMKTSPQVWAQRYVEKFLEERFSNPNHSDLIEEALINSIETLDNLRQTILRLRYGQRMDVEEIADYCSKIKIAELAEVTQELSAAKNQLQEAVITQINNLKLDCVHSWLKSYYQQIVHIQLLEAFKKLEVSIQELIQMQYCQRIAEQQLVILKPSWNVKQATSHAKQQLQSSLIQWVYDVFGLSLEPEKEQVNEVVEVWLKTLYSVEL
ncbi:XRE family transcriptional regulator [Coleofasciculus sp. FACHB-SPT9]|uniref:XRE family transcriptional regulator n=1 Tax=Cyanophyceae TaxID=3028117 RepID=UPI0016876EB2|nr:XRE family transcriptional regulator [Coleofasciculus sp. FACHB-SPT9]MBD1892998.1 XRE family transcriptional regulator [Coleofasciculus sp. FACHB-SPT9]